MAYTKPHDKQCFFSFTSCICGDPENKGTHKAAAFPNLRDIDHWTPEEMKTTQDSISSEFNKLSFQERSKALDDLHCVGEELEEDDEIVHRSLMEFQRVLEGDSYPMYDKAACLNRDYVENPSFRLWFLRANMHDVKRSVRQMENHLANKAKYFGEDKIARDITYEDLDDEVKELLLSGLVHIQESRDPSGRVILMIFNNMLSGWSSDTFIRAHYFVMHSILIPIPEVQKKGLVVVYYDMSKGDKKISLPSFQELLNMKKYRPSVPIRFSAFHICIKSTVGQNLAMQSSFLDFALTYLNQYTITRTRVHCGSALEIQHSLCRYGIIHDTLPMDMNGNVRSSNTNVWLDNYLAAERNKSHPYLGNVLSFSDDREETIESAGDNPATTQHDTSPSKSKRSENEECAALLNQVGSIEPAIHDVLLGRGVRLMKHPGNVNFRKCIDKYQAEYDKEPRSSRRNVSMKVVSELKSEGIQFLHQREGSVWVETDLSDAVNKVQQLFRSRRKLKK